MKTMPDKSVDAVITDPPYGLNYEYSEYIDTPENLIDLISSFIPESKRIAQRTIVLSGITPMFQYPPPTWTIAVTWNTTGSHGFYGYTQWMPVLCYGKDIKGIGKINEVLKSDVISISGGGGVGFMRDGIENEHPCAKPINIMRLIMRRLSNSGDTIFDPFMGSGTTGVACVQLGRNFIGCEIDPKYFAIAEKRIHEAEMQPQLFQTKDRDVSEIQESLI
jgi:DNA modification methylase